MFGKELDRKIRREKFPDPIPETAPEKVRRGLHLEIGGESCTIKRSAHWPQVHKKKKKTPSGCKKR